MIKFLCNCILHYSLSLWLYFSYQQIVYTLKWLKSESHNFGHSTTLTVCSWKRTSSWRQSQLVTGTDRFTNCHLHQSIKSTFRFIQITRNNLLLDFSLQKTKQNQLIILILIWNGYQCKYVLKKPLIND